MKLLLWHRNLSPLMIGDSMHAGKPADTCFVLPMHWSQDDVSVRKGKEGEQKRITQSDKRTSAVAVKRRVWRPERREDLHLSESGARLQVKRAEGVSRDPQKRERMGCCCFFLRPS